MAGREPSTTRRALLGAAASLPVLALTASERAGGTDVVRPERSRGALLWHDRLARYRRLAAEAEQAAATGWFAAANARYEREQAEIAARFGSWEAARETEEGRRHRRTAFDRVDRAEDLYWRRCTDPMQKAAVALVLTLAPDLEALRTKIAVIRAHQLHELDSMIRDCFEVLEEDVGRLSVLN